MKPLPKTMAKNKKRANDGEGASSSSSPPLKRQRIAAASSSSAVSIDEMAARILQLEQRLQSAEDEVARLQERLQQQEEQVQRLQLLEEEVVQPLQEEVQRLRPYEEAVCKQRYGPSWNGKTTDIDIIDNLARLGPLAVHYNANVTNQFTCLKCCGGKKYSNRS